ncbi:MAG: TIGR02147 family protein [Chitinispirillaceae bacterium]|nr:TIGR02147 family protein [Chitinispirillaceae bacterium]
MPNIFEYQDFRTYLKNYYDEQKALKKNFSYRYFSKKAGVNTPSFLYYVIENKRNLTESSVLKISQAIGHSPEEAEYFENLAFFNQAKTINEKTHYYSRLIEIRRPIDIQNIEADRYEYYSKWYHSVIREVATLVNFQDDFARLGSFLIPPVSAREAKESIVLLKRLGFLERDEKGLYHQTNNLILGRPAPLQSFQIERFQLEMLRMAIRAYDNVPIKNRLSNSTTLSVSTKTVELYKLKIRELQRDLMEIARMDDMQEQAIQITVNLFPVSRTKNGSDE